MSIYALSNDLKKNELHRAYLEQELSALSDSEKEKILEIEQSLEKTKQLIDHVAYKLRQKLMEQSKKREALYNIAIKFNDSETAKRCSDEIVQYDEQIKAIENDHFNNTGSVTSWIEVIEKQNSGRKSVFAQMAWFVSQRDHLISLFNHAKKSGDVDLQQSLREEYAEILEQQHNFTQGLGFFKAIIADLYKTYLVIKPRKKNISSSSEEKQKQLRKQLKEKFKNFFERNRISTLFAEIYSKVKDRFQNLTDKLKQKTGMSIGATATTVGAAAAAGCGTKILVQFALAKAVITLPTLGSVAALPIATSLLIGAAATAVAGGVVGALLTRMTLSKENRTFEKYLTSALKGTATGLIAGTTVLVTTSLFGPVPFGFIAAMGAGSLTGALTRLGSSLLNGKEYFKNNWRSALKMGSILGALGGLGGALFQHLFLNNAIATPVETPGAGTAPKTPVPTETPGAGTAPKTPAPAETPEPSTAPKTRPTTGIKKSMPHHVGTKQQHLDEIARFKKEVLDNIDKSLKRKLAVNGIINNSGVPEPVAAALRQKALKAYYGDLEYWKRSVQYGPR